MNSRAPLVWIVVLNWNGKEDTLQCLASINALTYPNYRVAVLDNSSTDGSVSEIRHPHPDAVVIENGRNLGYAEGNNTGIRRALDEGAEYVLILNNDTVVDPRMLDELVKAAESFPHAGMFSPKIYYADNPNTIWYAGATWDMGKSSFSHDGQDIVDDGVSFSKLRETDYASGCALFARSSVIRKIGLMEPRFFLTYEESDWCYRSRKAGHASMFVPDAKLWHKVSSSFGGTQTPLQVYFYARNLPYWAERNLSLSQATGVIRKTWSSLFHYPVPQSGKPAAKKLYWFLRNNYLRLRKNGNDPAGRARFLGFRDYLLRRFGDCPQEIRELNRLAGTRSRQHDGVMPPFGFNLIGMASANVGLGLTLRELAKALVRKGYGISILDQDAGHGRSGENLALANLFVSSAADLPYAVNIYVEGAHILPHFVLYPPEGLITENRLNVGFVWWELPILPDNLKEAAGFFDVLIAGSEFIQSALSNSVPASPVLLARHPLEFPESIQPDRSRFNLPGNAFLIGVSFDPHSDPFRKNPLAVIDAFQQAFPDGQANQLVIKISNSRGVKGQARLLLDAMHARIANDSRIHVVEETLSYPDLLTLYASCDAFMSLHRSEGLGLVPLEAMLLGKPVVATAWSGNMSYMNHLNACLVSVDLIPISNESPFYGHDALGIHGQWANPSIPQAASWLKKLASDPEFRLSIGCRAREDALGYLSQAEEVPFARELQAIWDRRALLPRRNRALLKQKVRESLFRENLRKMPWHRRIMARLARPVHDSLSRHVLWRFRGKHS